jgi:hypothetical protein
VIRAQRGPDGGRTLWLKTVCQTARACPSCGVFSRRSKGVVRTSPRDLPCGAGCLDLVWVKCRWFCRERCCPRTSFTESLPVIPHRARLTARLRAEAGDRVKDGTCATVLAAARQLGLSWPTVAVDANARVAGAPGGNAITGGACRVTGPPRILSARRGADRRRGTRAEAGWPAPHASFYQHAGVQYPRRADRGEAGTTGGAARSFDSISSRMSLRSGGAVRSPFVAGIDRAGGVDCSADRVAATGLDADTLAGAGVSGVRVTTRGGRQCPDRLPDARPAGA